MEFAHTAEGYRALHKHLFQDVYEWAGKDRTIDLQKPGAMFARTPYIAPSLDAAFKELGTRNNLRGLHREEFFDRLGSHINELNAIHPFREGNGRTMRQHAVQLAREAGHPIRVSAIDKQAWMEASRHGFTTGDHRAMSAVLATAALRRDLAPEARIGPGGIALLPPRDPPAGQRYRLPLAKAREELDKYLPAARQEAVERLRVMAKDAAPSGDIAAARTELAYVRHAKGPVYQSHLLTYLGQREVEAVISPKQTPLERVREIGAAFAVKINSQQPSQVQRAIRSLERPILPPGQSPMQERMADAFLKNTADKNRADPRFAPAQAMIDAAHNAALARRENPRAIEGAVEAARKEVAAKIRSGEPLDAKSVEKAARDPATPSLTPPTDRGRGR
jgi:cell filamentation protein